MLSELKKIEVQITLVSGYKKRNDRKIFHSSANLISSGSDIDESFKSMHQSIMTKIGNFTSKDWIVIETIIKHNVNIF